jgi:DNA-binding protein Fis
LNPIAGERVLILDQDEKTYSVIEEGTRPLEVTVQPCVDGFGPEDLRGQRYLLAFTAFPNDIFFQTEGLKSGASRLVVLAPSSFKRKALDMVGSDVFGFLTKPFQPEEACAVVRRALELQRVHRELNRLRTIEHLSEALMDRMRQMVKKADPSRKGDLFGFVKRCIEKPLLEMVLQETGGNRLKAANVLGINRNTLRTKLKEMSIDLRR